MGWGGGSNSDEGTETLVLCVYYNPLRLILLINLLQGYERKCKIYILSQAENISIIELLFPTAQSKELIQILRPCLLTVQCTVLCVLVTFYV